MFVLAKNCTDVLAPILYPFLKDDLFVLSVKKGGIFEPYLIQQKNEEMKKVKLLLRHNFSGHIRTPFPWMEVVNV